MVVKQLKSLLGINHSPNAGEDDRRRDPRQKVLLRATIYPIVGFADMLVRNASKTGLMGETSAELKISQVLHVSVDGRNYHSGTVRWTRGRRFGLDLSDALAILGLEDELDAGSSEVHKPRAKRFEVEISGRLALAGEGVLSTVRDVSRSGFKIDFPGSLSAGGDVLIKLKNRPLMLATVKWADAGRAGVKTVDRMATLRLVYDYDQ